MASSMDRGQFWAITYLTFLALSASLMADVTGRYSASTDHDGLSPTIIKMDDPGANDFPEDDKLVVTIRSAKSAEVSDWDASILFCSFVDIITTPVPKLPEMENGPVGKGAPGGCKNAFQLARSRVNSSCCARPAASAVNGETLSSASWPAKNKTLDTIRSCCSGVSLRHALYRSSSSPASSAFWRACSAKRLSSAMVESASSCARLASLAIKIPRATSPKTPTTTSRLLKSAP